MQKLDCYVEALRHKGSLKNTVNIEIEVPRFMAKAYYYYHHTHTYTHAGAYVNIIGSFTDDSALIFFHK